jgi:hypothetical protein
MRTTSKEWMVARFESDDLSNSPNHGFRCSVCDTEFTARSPAPDAVLGWASGFNWIYNSVAAAAATAAAAITAPGITLNFNFAPGSTAAAAPPVTMNFNYAGDGGATSARANLPLGWPLTFNWTHKGDTNASASVLGWATGSGFDWSYKPNSTTTASASVLGWATGSGFDWTYGGAGDDDTATGRPEPSAAASSGA